MLYRVTKQINDYSSEQNITTTTDKDVAMDLYISSCQAQNFFSLLEVKGSENTQNWKIISCRFIDVHGEENLEKELQYLLMNQMKEENLEYAQIAELREVQINELIQYIFNNMHWCPFKEESGIDF